MEIKPKLIYAALDAAHNRPRTIEDLSEWGRARAHIKAVALMIAADARRKALEEVDEECADHEYRLRSDANSTYGLECVLELREAIRALIDTPDPGEIK